MMNAENENELEPALARRLAGLGNLPVDTTTLDRALAGQLPPLPGHARRRLWAPFVAIAASFLLLAAIVFPLLQSREVQASPVLMAQMYHDMVDGRVPVMHANSLDDANRAIAALAGNFPTLPQPPAGHMMACCMRNVGNKKVACILLDNAGTPVTMVVANASDMQSPKSTTLVQDGTTYHVQATTDLHMVMTERDGRWVCLISELPQDKLVGLLQALHF